MNKENDNLRIRSGSIQFDSKLVSFLYELMRDHIPPGEMEVIINNSIDGITTYSNGWLANYANDIARRLLDKKLIIKMNKENLFEKLAREDPHQLADMINNNALKLCDLTYAAKYLGAECNNSNLVRKILVPLLNHPEAVVREGALIGLNCGYDPVTGKDHIDEPTERIIRDIALLDPSPAVKQVAWDILEDDS
jgi:hypothetical protein